MSKGDALVKNTLIIAIGKLSTQFLTFLLLPLYTVFLSPESFGQLDLITVYLGLLVPTLTVQMEMAVFRHLIDARGGSDARTGKIISSSFTVALAGAAVGAIGISIFGLILGLELTAYIVGAFITATLLQYLLQVARGIGRNDIFAIASIVTGLTNIVLSVVALTVLKLSLEGLLGALIVASITGAVVLAIKTGVLRHLRREYIDRKTTKELLQYSWPLVPNHAAIWGIGGISRTIVAMVLGFAAAGVYAAASKFTLIYTSFYSIFAMSWTESASLHLSKKDKFLSNATNSTVKLFGSLALLIISASGVAFPFLVSSEFSDARQYIPLLIIGGFFASLMTHYGAIYIAAKETLLIARVTLQAALLSTVLTLAGVWFIGLWAPTIALILTYIYITLRRHYDIQRLVSIQYNPRVFLQLGVLTGFVLLLYYIDNQVIDMVSVVATTLAVVAINRSDLHKIRTTILKKGKV